MTVVRTTVNQQVQIAVETTHGTTVAANKLLDTFTWTLGLSAASKQFQGSGQQYPSSSALLWEESKFSLTGPGDFAQMVYPFSGLWGSGSPALHSPSTTAYDWIWTPPLVGSYANNMKTFTVECGDPTTGDAEKYGYVGFTGAGYKLTRKAEMTFTAEGLAQTYTDGITMTATPTAIEKLPQVGSQFNVYLDPTSGAIGTTQLTGVMECEFKASDYYDEYYPINRSNASFTSLKDKLKKNEFTMTLQADATAIGLKATYFEAGALAYVRVSGVGPTIDAGHAVTAGMTHDMALFCSNVDQFSDTDGVYAIKYTFQVAADAAWSSGTAQKMTLTNLVSAL